MFYMKYGMECYKQENKSPKYEMSVVRNALTEWQNCFSLIRSFTVKKRENCFSNRPQNDAGISIYKS